MKTWTILAALVALLIAAFATSALANGVVVTPPAVSSEGTGPAPVIVPETQPVTPPAQITWTNEQLATMTVAEAWEYSGKDYAVFSRMVQDAANLSMQKRGIMIPDTKAAGNEIGCMIRQRAQADPNQLLYVVVDSSLRDYAARHPQAVKPATP